MKKGNNPKIHNYIMPRLWLSPSTTDSEDLNGDCDCDCNRSDHLHSSSWRLKSLYEDVTHNKLSFVELNPDIFLEGIDDKYTVALSATGSHIMVFGPHLNEFVSRIGNSPCSMRDLRKRAPWSSHVTDRLITILIAEDILLSPQLQSKAAQSNSSNVLTAWLHLANACNLSCSYCYLTFDNQYMNAATAKQAIESIFNSANLHGYSGVKLKYAGGEPSLNFKTLLQAHEYAMEMSTRLKIPMEASILTNGVRLTDDYITALRTHNIRVMISLDGLNDFHNVQRPLAKSGDPSFENVVSTVNRLLASNIRPFISVTITKRNVLGLNKLVEFCLNRGLRFGLNFYREPTKSSFHQQLSLDEKELITELKSAYKLIEQNLPSYSLLSSLADRVDLAAPHLYTCGVGRNYLVVNHDGNIAKCQMDIGVAVSNIYVNDPLGAIQSDLTGIINLSVDEKECKDCVWRYRCTGGCPRLTFQSTGRYDSKSPMCSVYEAILPEIVKLEGRRMLKFESSLDLSDQNLEIMENMFTSVNIKDKYHVNGL